MMALVTDAELCNASNEAQKMAKELNDMFRRTSLRELYQTQRVVFCYHPSVVSGELGVDYKHGTTEWANNGALTQLMRMLDKDVPGDIPTFVAGTFGSVWFDVDLTGGNGEHQRTKMVRVTPVRHRDGSFSMILDNTFDSKW